MVTSRTHKLVGTPRLAVLLIAGLGASLASAQTDQPGGPGGAAAFPESPGDSAPSDPNPPPPPAFPATGDVAETLSPQAMLERAAEIVARIESAHEQLQLLLEESADQRDVVMVLCVSDKNNQVQLALDTAKERSASMSEAIESGDELRARHEFRLLVVVGDSVREIAVDASQCLGGDDVPTQWTLIADVDSSVPQMDPKELPFADVAAIVPVVGSPTQ